MSAKPQHKSKNAIAPGSLWSRSQISAMADMAILMKRPAVALAITLNEFWGQRISDLVELKMKDFDGAKLKLTQNMSKRDVILPLNAILHEIDIEAQEMFKNKDHFANASADAPLLQKRNGDAYSPNELIFAFQYVQDELADSDASIAALNFRDLRHTAVVRLASIGANVPQIASIVGVSAPQVNTILNHHGAATDKSKSADFTKLMNGGV